MKHRFLIIQLADIGDLILSTPALSALRDAYPDAHVAVLTTAHAAPVLDGTGLADEIITFDKHTFNSPKALLRPNNLRRAVALAIKLRRGRYDTAIFFHHFTTRFGTLKFAALTWSADAVNRIGLDNGKGFFLTRRLTDEGFGARHQAQYWLDLVGLIGADSTPRAARIATAPLVDLHRFTSPLRIAIHAGSGGYSLARRWDAAKFAQVADRLSEAYDAQIVLVGGANDDSARVRELMRGDAIDLSGQTSLSELAGLLESCDLFIGADSGVMHVAAAVGTRVVAVFGPSNPDAWRPWTPNGRHMVVRSAPECSPCSYVGHTIGLREGSEARTCMKMVTPDHVVTAARRLLDAARVERGEGSIVAEQATDGGAQAESYAGTLVGAQHAAPLHPVRLTNDKPDSVEQIDILGIPVSAVTYDQWMRLIGEWVREEGGRLHHVCTVNPEMVMIAQGDFKFRIILQRADLTVPDGVGLLWAARHLGRPLPERVTGSDGVPWIAAEAARQDWRIFLLGAAPGVADRAADVLRERSPGVPIVGTFAGSPAPDEEDAIVERVNASGADILFVAYGAPEQDKWIARNSPRLNVKMAMGVGGSLDFVAGVIPRAPISMQRMGLEWLYRLYLQPSRIGRMMRLPRFVLAVLLKRAP